MCRAMEEMRCQEREEGRAEGRAEERKSFVLPMLEAGKYALQEISKLSGFTIAELEAMKTELETGQQGKPSYTER